jgi:hypothetical protein
MAKEVGLLVIHLRLVILGTLRVIQCFPRSCLLSSLVTVEFLGHHLLLVFLALRRQGTIWRNDIVFYSLLLFLLNLLLTCCSLLNLSNRYAHKILRESNSNKGILLRNEGRSDNLRSWTCDHWVSRVNTHCAETGVTSIKLFLA